MALKLLDSLGEQIGSFRATLDRPRTHRRAKQSINDFNSRVPRLVIQLACLMALPVSAWSQITLVHVTSCGKQNFPSACTIPATTAGNLIVVGFQAGGPNEGSITISSMSDNIGNTYAEAGAARAVDTSQGLMIDLWYAKNVLAGANSITITTNASCPGSGAVIWEFSGVDTSAPLDQTAVLNNQASTTTPAAAAVTISSPNEVVVSIAEEANVMNGIVSGNSFTNDSTLMSNGWAHLVTTSAGTYYAQWNQTPAGPYAASTTSFKAAASGGGGAASACDLNADGKVNVVDVQLVTNMYLGVQPCTANIVGPNICNQQAVSQVSNAALGSSCVTAGSHSVAFSWTASTSQNVVAYNVYRASTSGGYSTPLASVPSSTLSYTDNTVIANQTYYYVVKSVDNNGMVSTNSNEISAVIPFP
jgi:hypothetical protein